MFRAAFVEFWQYQAKRFRWATKGVWGRVERIATVVGLVLATVVWLNPEWSRSHISERMNAFILGAIPLLSGASVFVVRWLLSPYFIYRSDTERLNFRNRKLQRRLQDIKTRRPRFRYDSEKSRIESRIIERGDKFFGQLYLGLGYRNKGAGTAHRLKLTAHYCWLNDIGNIVDQSSDEGQAAWETDDLTGIQIYATQPATAMSTGDQTRRWIFDADGFVAVLEFQYRANADDGLPCKDEHWIHWSPLFPNGLGSCSREMIDQVKPRVDSFKKKQTVTQPLLTLDEGELSGQQRD
jgi:hypothetical protein